jgi:hypothetical protein
MSEPDRRSDIDKLLAEVESSLSGKPAPATPARRDEAPVATSGGGLRARTRTAVVVGAGSAGVVLLLFALLPFLGAISGAAGAFLGAFVAALLFRRRR